jgi:hypothetical protein
MTRFRASVADYCRALVVVFQSSWGWIPILFISSLAFSFGYGAMTEGKYILAVILYVVGVGVVTVKANHDFRTHELSKPIATIIIVVAVAILGGLFAWTKWTSKAVAPLTLTFRRPTKVEWQITNDSDKIVARDVLYYFGLWSLDNPSAGTRPTDPLLMPVRRIDFINPKDSAGGLVFDLGLNIRPDERFFGIATINCPGCEEQAFWLYINNGHGGWFAKMEGTSRGKEVPMGAIVVNTDASLERLVPTNQRIPIN